MTNVIAYDFNRDSSDSIILAERKAKPSRTFTKYAAMLKARRALTKSEILGLAWVLNGVKKINISAPERNQLRDLVADREGRRISKELTDFGINWLRNTAFKLNGSCRKNCPFEDWQVAILHSFSHFTWVGYRNTQEDYGNYRSQYESNTPIWRVHATNGAYFDYYVLGGGPGGSRELVIF